MAETVASRIEGMPAVVNGDMGVYAKETVPDEPEDRYMLATSDAASTEETNKNTVTSMGEATESKKSRIASRVSKAKGKSPAHITYGIQREEDHRLKRSSTVGQCIVDRSVASGVNSTIAVFLIIVKAVFNKTDFYSINSLI
ncbi:hypothetical protein ColLi_12155 [Colletotrichum liriopes]|uniref:Uncharacterized protein n=1 Tax=Colletotrichum liriopes TaxID=708192 RepID=A0AA37GYF1_9PEZI|nr:hypothetical protein ColLi_12155 [Colletotrichum liriopes]